MDTIDGQKPTKYLRRAGERAKPSLPTFTEDKGLDELIPPTTIMAMYKATAESIYRAESLCEAEQKVWLCDVTSLAFVLYVCRLVTTTAAVV